MIEKVYMYHILTNTDSTSLQFLFENDPASDITESKYWEIIFEVICASEIYNRFDRLNKFGTKFDVQKPSLYKCLGYFSVENIENPFCLTIACSPKKYFEMFENNLVIKKHKGSSGMCFENNTSRIVSLANFDYFQKPPAEYKEVARLTLDKGKMQKKTSLKTKCSQFNDKRFYFSDLTTFVSSALKRTGGF